MKIRRSNTLMFQLVVCFSVIMAGVLALIITSWSITKQEAENSATISALTVPYAQLQADLSRLRDSKFDVLGIEEGTQAEGAEVLRNIRASADTLMRLLNEDGFNRSSIDLNNTLSSYQDVYNTIIENYAAQQYAQADAAVQRLDQTERWIQGYLAQTGIAITQRQETLREQSSITRYYYYRGMLLVGSMVFAACLLVLIMAARRFVAPVEELCKNVRNFRLSDSLEELKKNGVPCKRGSLQEIRTLATAIYSMENAVLDQYTIERHNEMLRGKLSEEALRSARMEKRLQEAQLRALQAQINPHFLFNTLNMIGQMSYLEGAEKTSELLEIFSDYFRYNVDSFERNVTLAEELENVRGYIALQEERFGDRIRYNVHMDEAVQRICVPCLIIQPLVENAISHGLSMKTEGGAVCVSVHSLEDGGFEITVIDNGRGMDEPSLRTLATRLAQPDQEDSLEHSSIGIFNVVSRMRISFRDAFSFDLKSALEEGFQISLRVEGGDAFGVETADRR